MSDSELIEHIAGFYSEVAKTPKITEAQTRKAAELFQQAIAGMKRVGASQPGQKRRSVRPHSQRQIEYAYALMALSLADIQEAESTHLLRDGIKEARRSIQVESVEQENRRRINAIPPDDPNAARDAKLMTEHTDWDWYVNERYVRQRIAEAYLLDAAGGKRYRDEIAAFVARFPTMDMKFIEWGRGERAVFFSWRNACGLGPDVQARCEKEIRAKYPPKEQHFAALKEKALIAEQCVPFDLLVPDRHCAAAVEAIPILYAEARALDPDHAMDYPVDAIPTLATTRRLLRDLIKWCDSPAKGENGCCNRHGDCSTRGNWPDAYDRHTAALARYDVQGNCGDEGPAQLLAGETRGRCLCRRGKSRYGTPPLFVSLRRRARVRGEDNSKTH